MWKDDNGRYHIWLSDSEMEKLIEVYQSDRFKELKAAHHTNSFGYLALMITPTHIGCSTEFGFRESQARQNDFILIEEITDYDNW